MTKKLTDVIFAYANIPKSLIHCDFSNYRLSNKLDVQVKQSKNIQLLQSIANNYNKKDCKHRIITLCGSTGTGKTHLSIATARNIIKKHSASLQFLKLGDLLRDIKTGWSDKTSSTENELIKKPRYCDILILDELGLVQRNSKWSNEIVYSIIDYRYERDKMTIVTTNYTRKQLEKYYKCAMSALYSRFFDKNNIILEFDWSDFRTSVEL